MLQLKQSLESEQEKKQFTEKQFKEYLKTEVCLDFEKLEGLDIVQNLKLSDIKTKL